ncbi:ketopantoate reductase family protein [Herbiconiux daphne]|uniref:2-dehydropantoate 2-reductase n=1 Tax=Herbiconiux daphne TaxID=2970914 RepID=A0ABT2H575_9MICO|nr:2-dehydropantoate 2-reductase [Herbiconiux daphne]MCS5735087.1 2-dehydropantoate 2-reductase [Herbiconiux daphne]
MTSGSSSVVLRRPSVAVVGAGAIGTVIADAMTGVASVTLCRRNTNHSMLIDRGKGGEQVRARVASSPKSVSEVDWVVLATKAQDVPGASDWLDALVGPNTKVAVLQNGINHADRVSSWVPATRVVPAIVYILAERTAPDLVAVRQIDQLVLPHTELASEFAALFAEDFPARVDQDFDTYAWRKLVMNAALNSVTALTGRPVSVAREDAGRELIATVLTEGVNVARARGVMFDEDEISLMQRKIDGLPPSATTSMQLDRANGRSLEYQYLTGAVLEEAETAGISAPTTKTLHDLISTL